MISRLHKELPQHNWGAMNCVGQRQEQVAKSGGKTKLPSAAGENIHVTCSREAFQPPEQMISITFAFESRGKSPRSVSRQVAVWSWSEVRWKEGIPHENWVNSSPGCSALRSQGF